MYQEWLGGRWHLQVVDLALLSICAFTTFLASQQLQSNAREEAVRIESAD